MSLNKLFALQDIIAINLESRNLHTYNFRELLKRGIFDVADISLLILSRMLNTVIATICGEKFWLSTTTLKFNDISIIVGLEADGSVYSTGVNIFR